VIFSGFHFSIRNPFDIIKEINMKRFLLSYWQILIPWIIVLVLGVYPIPSVIQAHFLTTQSTKSNPNPEVQAQALQAIAQVYTWRGDLWDQAGQDYLAAGYFEAAQDCLLVALDLNELSDLGRMALGDVYHHLGEDQQAVKYWEDLLQSEELTADIHLRLLHFYVNNENLTSAVNFYDSWTPWGIDSAKDIFHLGLLLAVDLSDQSIDVLSKAADLNSELKPSLRIMESGIYGSNLEDPLAYRLLLVGRSLTSLGEWDLAVTAFEKSTQAAPQYAEAWAFLSMAQEQVGVDGLPALENAVALKPDSILIQAMQSIYWTNHGNLKMALVSLYQIAEQEPENSIWQVEIGNSLANLGDLVSSLTYFQKAVELEPDNPVYWRDLAAFSLKYNVQIEDIGLPAARQAVILDSSNADGLDLLAQFFINEGDLYSAQRMLLKAVDVDPQNSYAHYHLGMVYLELGEGDLAYQAFQAAMNLAKDQDPILVDQIQRVLDQYFP
jgi:tetratricopeptide (TPR) repeat protein